MEKQIVLLVTVSYLLNIIFPGLEKVGDHWFIHTLL